MKLKKKYQNQGDIPTFAKALFHEVDGDWVPVEGVDIDAMNQQFAADPAPAPEGKSKHLLDRVRSVEQERDAAREENRQLKTQYGGITPEQLETFQKQLAEMEEEEDKRLIESGDINAVVQRRTARTIEEKERDLQAVTAAREAAEKERDKFKGKWTTHQATSLMETTIAAQKLRVRPDARDVLHQVVQNDWTVDDEGNLKLKKKIYGEGGTEMQPDEYVRKELLEKKSFLFEPAKGGGADGNDTDTPTDGRGLVKRDPLEIGRNLEDIVSGKKRVARD